MALLWAGTAAASTPEYADLSLEQLSEVTVSSVSRRAERLDAVPAAVFVIQAEDIRRSGATSLPGAMRLAPQLIVARADANQYAISARGFNNVLANKLLVLIDGRPVYSPLFSGVFWEAQDILLEDIERIEVVTGPSTAMWGTNAVNGLIHVITKSAVATQGVSAEAHAGSTERGAALRFGGEAGDDAHYRVSVRAHDRSNTEQADGTALRDGADGVQATFRGDWSRGDDALQFQAALYESTIDQAPVAREVSGGHLRGQWARGHDDGRATLVQVYAEQTERRQAGGFGESRNTADLVAQHEFEPASGQHSVVGLGYRHSRGRVDNTPSIAFEPALQDAAWSRVFAQNQSVLLPGLELTLAGNVERNPYTGTEFLPSLRIAWQTGYQHLAWASLSRAVRAPSRIDRDLYQPDQAPGGLAGGPDFQSEVANVGELGLRGQPHPRLSYAATLFHHEHKGLRSATATPVGLQWQNHLEGYTRGLEMSGSWRVADSWKLAAGGVWLRTRLHASPGTVDAGGRRSLGNDPDSVWSLRSAWDITAWLRWDVNIRHVDALPDPAVPAYTAVDSRLAWQYAPDLEVSVTVLNAFDPSHAEWGASPGRAEFQRSAALQLRWRL
ncbi:TonB-dependent receptor plug domain-containing protein [Rhizobacter sp. LjRoot28]|uniref:TonB-dependent receptor plug domain-containing protein n=1 Tax=Rhizobacter sp. LjRoot28 TaxID=3342309 RepID=UPI003ECFA2B9